MNFIPQIHIKKQNPVYGIRQPLSEMGMSSAVSTRAQCSPGILFCLDEPSQLPLSIKLDSLNLFAVADSVRTTPSRERSTKLSEVSQAIGTYSAMMRFSVDGDGEVKKSKSSSLKLRTLRYSIPMRFANSYGSFAIRNKPILSNSSAGPEWVIWDLHWYAKVPLQIHVI